MLPHVVHVGGKPKVLDGSNRATVTALFDRLIPHDEHGPSASEAGCVDFLDAQLAGPFGASADQYLQRPLEANESELMGGLVELRTRKDQYLSGLQILNQTAMRESGKPISQLAPAQIDSVLTRLEAGKLDLDKPGSGKALFELMLQNVREGYLSDPLYGGNRDMAGWKMVGFPGARYDYRPYVDRKGQALGLIPISLIPNS
ncbi:gluconate 2-dehydrogenase subunit 3 family protein [Paraburkholderia sp. Ac-20347]|nr:gluconate 2-dehydrogenase subunit 3 family protein [Paraburkholderia sp. Ac-20347]MBN3812520.1 gluconate 2-dehydrogenase subunit 3 family protein [Paraburkholderia sp. Ac-20347]